MKFEEALVYNFGKLKNFKMDFSPNINIIYGKNETGKSTLQTFLWAMLYGLVDSDNRTRRKLKEFDKFLPWDNSLKYGGVLKYLLDSGQKIEVHRLFEPHQLEIIDGIKGTNITSQFELKKNKESNFAFEQTGLTYREFINTTFIRQLKIHELDEDDQTHISERLIHLAETGDEELSVKKAIERIELVIRNKIGVEDLRSVKPLRQAMDFKDEIGKKLLLARENHNNILEMMQSLQKKKSELNEKTNKKNNLSDALLWKEISDLEKKLQEILNQEENFKKIEAQIENIESFAFFNKNESVNSKVIELSSNGNELKKEIEKINETLKPFYSKRNSIKEKMKSYANFDSVNREQIDKLSALESENNILQYNLLKEKNHHLSTLNQDLNKTSKEIEAFQLKTGKYDNSILEKIQTKEFQELNLRLKQKEIDKLEEEIKNKNFYLNENEKKVKINKIFLIVFYSIFLSIIIYLFFLHYALIYIFYILAAGNLFGIPYALFTTKFNSKTENNKKELDKLNENINSLKEIFDIDNKNYQEIHKIQINLQERLEVSNFPELKVKYNELLKMENNRLLLEEKIKDSNNKIQEYHKKLYDINDKLSTFLMQYQVQNLKIFKDKYKEYSELSEQMNKNNREIEINKRILNEKEEKLKNINENLQLIFKDANVKDFDEFQIFYKKFQKNKKMQTESQAIKEKIFFLTSGKSEEELKNIINNLILKTKIPRHVFSELNNKKDQELKNEEEILIKETRSLEDEIIELEAKLKYSKDDLDTVSELEAIEEEQDKKINYLKVEKEALEIAMKSIEEIAENFHRTRFMPELKKMVKPWLEEITENYEEIMVDEKLQVRVRIPDLEKVVDIDKLSAGAQEQIYFIFKTSIGRILTKGGEKVPIVLDDIFVNFDSTRRNKAWEILLNLSKETQLIMFTCHKKFIDEWINLLNRSDLRYTKGDYLPYFEILKIN